MYYVTKMASGIAQFHTAPPTSGSYFEIETLPNMDGVVYVNDDGTLYNGGTNAPIPISTGGAEGLETKVDELAQAFDIIAEGIL